MVLHAVRITSAVSVVNRLPFSCRYTIPGHRGMADASWRTPASVRVVVERSRRVSDRHTGRCLARARAKLSPRLLYPRSRRSSCTQFGNSTANEAPVVAVLQSIRHDETSRLASPRSACDVASSCSAFSCRVVLLFRTRCRSARHYGSIGANRRISSRSSPLSDRFRCSRRRHVGRVAASRAMHGGPSEQSHKFRCSRLGWCTMASVMYCRWNLGDTTP